MPRPLGPGRVAVTALLVLAGMAVCLTRTSGPGPFNSIWAEDAKFFMTDALNKHAWAAAATPFAGYYHLLPRLLTGVAKPFGVAWMPAVMTVEAALVVCVLALCVYVASGRHLPGVLPRLLVSVPLVAGPIYGSVPNNVATLQFSLVYAAFWMLLWNPVRRGARCVAVVVLVAAACSTILTVVLVPLAVLRLYACRDRYSGLAVGAFLLGVCQQVVPHVLGLTPRDVSHPRYDPVWASYEYATWALPRQVVGQTWSQAGTSGTHLRAIVATWALLGCVVFVALARFSRPDWLLAGVASASSVLMFTFAIMMHGSPQYRYALTSGLLLLVALAALVQPRPERFASGAALPIGALLCLFAVVGAANLRLDDYRDHTDPWNRLVSAARAQCRTERERGSVTIFTAPDGPWYAVVPCRYLDR